MDNHIIFSIVATILLYVSTGYAASAMEHRSAEDDASGEMVLLPQV